MKSERGWGPFHERWYSICSAHRKPKDGCPRCACGQWRNTYQLKLSRAVHKRWPKVWLAWANRPIWNPSARFLESTFPRLRMDRSLVDWFKRYIWSPK